ncbi:MAG: hypothetical protein K2W82_07480 [Candidatus Obscuribacterales bacterium]|nr:hypothetical protein [Candidatus Obscuribacterales bacterium]
MSLSKSASHPVLWSRVLWAALLVLGLDFWLGTAHPLQFAVTPNLDRTETFGSRQAYTKQNNQCDLLLLGSSLVVAPVMQAEALARKEPIVRFRQRQSKFIADSLSAKISCRPDVFCFAVAGAAVSDAYLIARNIFAAEKRPAAIVYGVAPRDFQDNTWPGIDSTEAFQVLADLPEAAQICQSNELSAERKLGVVLGRISSLWRYRSDMRLLLTLRIKKLMERTMPWVVFPKYGSTLELKPQKRGQFPEEAIGELRVFPGVAMENVGSQRTIEQYINRYRPLNEKNVDLQFAHLEKLSALCAAKKVRLVIVNMPLSKTNLKLLPDNFYKLYKERLSALCNRSGLEYIDMQLSAYEPDEKYVDTVHLKPEYSQSFLELLTDRLCQTKTIAVLQTHMRQIASGKNNLL